MTRRLQNSHVRGAIVLSRDLCIAVILFALGGFSFSTAAEGSSWQELLERVEEAREEGDNQKALGLARAALAAAQKEFGANHASVAKALVVLAEVHHALGQFAEAAPLCRQACSTAERVLGGDDPARAEILERVGVLYLNIGQHAEARRLFENALAIREKTADSQHRVVRDLELLGQARQGQGNLKAAEETYLRALGMAKTIWRDKGPELAGILRNLSALYRQLGRVPEAELCERQAKLAEERTLEGPDAGKVAALFSEAALKKGRGELAQAEMVLEELAGIFEQSENTQHPDYVRCLSDLGEVLTGQGKFEEAEPRLRQAVETANQTLGEEHPVVGKLLLMLGDVYLDQGKTAEANALFQKGISIAEVGLGPDHPATAMSLSGLANGHLRRGEHEEARKLFERMLVVFEKAFGPEHPDLLDPLLGLGKIAYEQGNLVEAENLYKRFLAIAEKAAGPEDPRAIEAQLRLADVYRQHNRLPEANALVEQAAKASLGTAGSHARRAQALLYYQQGRYAEAEPLLKEALAVQEKISRSSDPDLMTSLYNLARLYGDQGKTREAEAHLARLRDIEQASGQPFVPLNDRYENWARIGNWPMERLQQAESMLERALALEEKVLGAEHAAVVQTLRVLAVVSSVQGNHAKAGTLAKRAAAAAERALASNPEESANLLMDLLWVFFQARMLEEVESIAEKITRSVEQGRFFVAPEKLMVVWRALGSAYYHRKQYPQAEPLYARLWQMLQQPGLPQGVTKTQLQQFVEEYLSVLRELGAQAKLEEVRRQARAVLGNY